jgi:ABC-type uncharacterized transport system substrate-binding protein
MVARRKRRFRRWAAHMHKLRLLLAAMTGLLLASSAAQAHPHVWVTIKSQVLYAADGTVTGVRHIWTFDEMFSTFASQGLDKNNDGTLSREELAELAEVNVTSMKDFDYFTKAKANGKPVSFEGPKDYFLEEKNKMLTLNFTLPLTAPAKAQSFDVDVYDGTFFVAFAMEEKDAVTLVNAPSQCKLNVAQPKDAKAQSKPLSESFFNQLDPSSSYGAQFANKISVKCS